MSESEPAPTQAIAVYVSKDGQPTGPFSIDQLRAMVAQGSVPDSELAWHEGAAGWIPLAELLRGRSGVASTTPPPAFIGPKNPRLGLAGAIIGLAGIPIWSGILVFAVTGQHSGNESLRMTFMGLSVIAMLGVNIVGAVLGFIAMSRKSERKTWIVAGLALNLIACLGILLLMVIGLMVKS